MRKILVWFNFGFVGYLVPNPFLNIETVLVQTIQFNIQEVWDRLKISLYNET